MSPEQLTEGLAAAARCLRPELLEQAEAIASAGSIEVVRGPAPRSLLLELDSPVGPFCFTEAVVTTAEVRVGGSPGWGCVLGYDEQGALAGALLDAVPDPAVEALAQRALASEAARHQEAARAVAATRVGGEQGAGGSHG